MSNPRLQRTRDYSQFKFTKENRDVDLTHLRPEHKRLRESMKKYGFLPSKPIMVRAVNGRLIATDGQHRITFAKEFGLDVFYVIDDTDINISEVNQAQAGWLTKDYAKRWAQTGRKDYVDALTFAETFGIPIGLSFAMLAGTLTFGNLAERFRDGNYKIKQGNQAYRVASLYVDLVAINPKVKKVNTIRAIYQCCLLDYFDDARLLETATKKPELLVAMGTADAVLEVFEDIYNFGRKTKVPLKFDAEQASAARALGGNGPTKAASKPSKGNQHE